MGKVILICGKICSGKTSYAARIRERENAVLLSVDEATFALTQNEQGAFYNVLARRINGYLRRKAVEIARAGCNVILDWGFWSRDDRRDIAAYLRENGTAYEWHYVAVDDAAWRQQIEARNSRVAQGGGGSDFYVDEGLLRKCLSLFCEPARDEMDVWYTPNA